jgi:hypothetical protein
MEKGQTSISAPYKNIMGFARIERGAFQSHRTRVREGLHANTAFRSPLESDHLAEEVTRTGSEPAPAAKLENICITRQCDKNPLKRAPNQSENQISKLKT